MVSRSDADDFCGVDPGELAGTLADGVVDGFLAIAGLPDDVREEAVNGTCPGPARIAALCGLGRPLPDLPNASCANGRDGVDFAPRVSENPRGLCRSVLLGVLISKVSSLEWSGGTGGLVLNGLTSPVVLLKLDRGCGRLRGICGPVADF